MASFNMRKRALDQAKRECPNGTSEDHAMIVMDLLSEWEFEAACDRDEAGIPEDTHCIQSADFWGTGEGRYHGVM